MGFALAPVALTDGRGARDVDIARAVGVVAILAGLTKT